MIVVVTLRHIQRAKGVMSCGGARCEVGAGRRDSIRRCIGAILVVFRDDVVGVVAATNGCLSKRVILEFAGSAATLPVIIVLGVVPIVVVASRAYREATYLTGTVNAGDRWTI